MKDTPAGKGVKNELDIQLLGGFAVSIDGVRIPEAQWKSRRARNLVKLLALTPGHRLHREQVMDTLWPDSDLSAAANNFHQTLHTTRRALAPGGADCLVLEEGFLSLAGSGGLVVDVDQFEALAAQAKGGQELEAYQAALDIYRGDLLPEDLYEEWTLVRREALHQTYLNLLLKMASLQEQQHEYAAGITLLEQVLAADRAQEDAHAGLMRLYALSGRRQQALRQYQRLREALQAELESEPGESTTQLYEAIQSGRFGAAAAQVSPPIGGTHAHNLPAQLTSFLGRGQEITQVSQRISSYRLVTLTGAGGIGKTRLALQVAERMQATFPNGAYLVELAPLSDPQQVPQGVANALGIREDPNLPCEDQLVRYLRSRELLLVLDNCEHLIKACAQLATRLLTSCPGLCILATSREGLGVEGEALYPLLPLPFPEAHRLKEVDTLKRYTAVQLFVERAALVRPGFTVTPQNEPAVTRVCQRLDGIPLALELAAARVNLLSVEQIAARLDDCFRLLAGGRRTVLHRHQTMRAALDWSHDLLSEAEQVLLRRLAVFAGGWTLEAAERVCSDDKPEATESAFSAPILEPADILDLLTQLVNKSMVITSKGDAAVMKAESGLEARYRLLEPVRQYAWSKMEQAGEVETLRDRHLRYFLDLADRTTQKPFQNRLPRQWKLLKHDLENLRTALGWALADDPGPRVEDGLRLVGMLLYFWMQAGLYREGLAWSAKALALTDGRGPHLDLLRALALDMNGVMISFTWFLQEGTLPLEESVALFRKCGDVWWLSQALADLGEFSYGTDPERSRAALEESVALARQVGDPIVLANSLLWKGDIENKQGNLAAAIRDCQESLKLFLEIGERGGACLPLVVLGSCAIQQGDIAEALQYRKDYLRYRPEIEDLSLDFFASGFLLHTSHHLGDFKQMEAVAQDLLDQDQTQVASIYSLRMLGFARKCQGDYQQAAACFYDGLRLSQEIKDYHGLYQSLSGLAGVAAQQGQPVRAARLFGAVEQLLEALQHPLDFIERGEFDRDVMIVRQALTAEGFSLSWAEGRAMTEEQAIEYALSENDSA